MAGQARTYDKVSGSASLFPLETLSEEKLEQKARDTNREE
jgi:hypothetical protein